MAQGESQSNTYAETESVSIVTLNKDKYLLLPMASLVVYKMNLVVWKLFENSEVARPMLRAMTR